MNHLHFEEALLIELYTLHAGGLHNAMCIWSCPCQNEQGAYQVLECNKIYTKQAHSNETISSKCIHKLLVVLKSHNKIVLAKMKFRDPVSDIKFSNSELQHRATHISSNPHKYIHKTKVKLKTRTKLIYGTVASQHNTEKNPNPGSFHN